MKFIAQNLSYFLLATSYQIGGCHRTDDDAAEAVQQTLEAVEVNDQTFLMENKATASLDFCGISTIKSIYDPEANRCFAVNVQMEPVQGETGWTGYIWTLELDGKDEKIVFDQSKTPLWINEKQGRIWCYGYRGTLNNSGLEKDVSAIFFTDKLATLTSDVSRSRVLYIASPDSVEKCDIFRKKT